MFMILSAWSTPSQFRLPSKNSPNSKADSPSKGNRLLNFCRLSHFPASFRASETNFGAFLAMLLVVFLAFLAACFANFCTQAANLLHKRAASLHRLQCKRTNVCAIPIHADAAGHHFDIVFIQAGAVALITGFHTFPASIDACFIGHLHCIYLQILSSFILCPCRHVIKLQISAYFLYHCLFGWVMRNAR